MTNKELIIDFSKQLWERRNLDVIEQFFSPDAVVLSPLNPARGHLTMLEVATKWLEAFPDLSVKWIDFIAEGDKVVSRWYATGTHLGSFFNTEPTHHEVSYCGVTTFTVQNKKITEYSALVDVHSILKQLGARRLSDAID